MTSRTAAQVARSLRLPVVVLSVGIAGSALASNIEASSVFRAVAGILDPGRSRVVSSVYVAPGGTVWVLWLDRGFWGGPNPRIPARFARNISGDGTRIGADVPILPKPGLEMLTAVRPVGVKSDSSLVIDVAPIGLSPQHLATVSTTGAVDVTDVLAPHTLGRPFVDRNDIAHLLPLSQRGVDYMQIDLSSAGLPTIRSLGYDEPFGGLPSAPGYLRWKRTCGDDGEVHFYSEEKGNLLVVVRRDRSDPFYKVYRINTETLALLDSSTISLTEDVYRAWSSPRIPSAVIVPAAESGYWFFAPTMDTAAPAVVAYRLRSDLTPERPAVTHASEVSPLSDAPAEATLTAHASCPFSEEWSGGGLDVSTELVVSFFAFGGDGQIYAQSLAENFTSFVRD